MEGELFAETAGADFTPHVVTVGTGEVMYISVRIFAPILNEVLGF